MGAMLKKFTQPKYLIFILAGILVLALIIWFAVRINSLQETSRGSTKLVSFDYCSEELTQLCVVSFGRDADGNTIVNLFVPEDEFPIFYLKVIRASGENVYECDRNDDVKTSVYCTGDPLNLEERFDIQVVSVKDDQPLAQGRFTLTAFLITGSTAGAGTPQSPTSEAASSTQALPTQTVFPTATNSLATPTTGASATATATSVTTVRATPTATSVTYPSYP